LAKKDLYALVMHIYGKSAANVIALAANGMPFFVKTIVA
jgi:hypothetical protein